MIGGQRRPGDAQRPQQSDAGQDQDRRRPRMPAARERGDQEEAGGGGEQPRRGERKPRPAAIPTMKAVAGGRSGALSSRRLVGLKSRVRRRLRERRPVASAPECRCCPTHCPAVDPEPPLARVTGRLAEIRQAAQRGAR